MSRFLDELVQLRDGQRVPVVGNIAVRWALLHRGHGTPLEELAREAFVWQPGWELALSR